MQSVEKTKAPCPSEIRALLKVPLLPPPHPLTVTPRPSSLDLVLVDNVVVGGRTAAAKTGLDEPLVQRV